MKSLALKIPPLVLTLVFAGLMLAAEMSFPGLSFHSAWPRLLSPLLLFLGLALVIAGVVRFRQHRTTIDPRDPALSSTLVTSGIYRVSRNPMYLGFLLVLAALALQLSNWLVLVFLPLFVLYMNRYQIGPEERALAERYGAAFSQYMAKVRRWL